jgi:hypothetical protein
MWAYLKFGKDLEIAILSAMIVSYHTPMPSDFVSASFCFQCDLKAEKRITDAQRLHASTSPGAGALRGCLTLHSGQVMRPQSPQTFLVAKKPNIFLYIQNKSVKLRNRDRKIQQ